MEIKLPVAPDVLPLQKPWGFYIGNTYTARKYRALNQITASDNLIRELEFQIPVDNIDVQFNFFNNTSTGWIPFGMYHDMADIGEPGSTTVLDNVSNYSILQLFRGLQQSVTTVQDFRREVLNRNGNLQAEQVNQLVSSYRY